MTGPLASPLEGRFIFGAHWPSVEALARLADLDLRFVRASASSRDTVLFEAAVPQPFPATIRLAEEPWNVGRVRVATLNLPANTGMTADDAQALFHTLAGIFAPLHAGLYHPLHRQAVRLPAINRTVEAAIVPPAGAELISDAIPGLPARTAELAMQIPPLALDPSKCPEGIWWLNFWSSPIIAQWPAGTVAAAPWQEIEVLADGLVLKASELPPGPSSPGGFEAVLNLTRILNLHKQQRAASIDPSRFADE